MPKDVKFALRQSLLEEQGCLCAYCMSRIHDRIKIERYERRNPQNEPEYSNLLAVCTRNSAGNQFEHQHCNTKKSNRRLHINPQNIDHIKQISYRSDGTIYARYSDFNADLRKSDIRGNEERLFLCKVRQRKKYDSISTQLHGRQIQVTPSDTSAFSEGD